MTEPPRSFQHYEVLRREDGTAWELGRGAMGVTYKAFDVNLCCEVALKVVSSALVENPEARERFVREARAAAALRHRNVASVYHLGNDGEHFFYAMEFINGDTLDAVVRRSGALSVENTLRVILQVARALAAAERQHLVHRDIKPANLMVTHEDADEETVVKVIDFGLARTAATAENAPPLTLGGFVGTPQYASPEQLEERPLDARSDLYSLGVTAWFLLTGRAPFAGSLATVCQRQLTEPPPWDLLPVGLPPGVRALLGRLLEKDAARRPQNAAELRAGIEACLDQIQGSARKRDLQLPALTAGAGTSGRTRTGGRLPQAGTLLGGRYRLLREIGGRDGVRVFQARDDSAADRLVAVKILPAAVGSAPIAQGDLAEEVRLIQAAAHPHLVQILAFEKSSAPAATFLVEEWLAGCTVRDLLAVRGGALPVVEMLSLLEQAASATDHAERCRLEGLDLSLQALHLTIGGARASVDEGPGARGLLSQSLASWPAWALKVPALRLERDPQALDTWAGGATLVPRAPGPAADGKDGGYMQGLARMVYEVLGGVITPLPSDAGSAGMRGAAIASLTEEANRVLRSALAGEGAFTEGWQLHEALVGALGDGPRRGAASPPPVGPALVSKTDSTEPPATRTRPSVTSPQTAGPGALLKSGQTPGDTAPGASARTDAFRDNDQAGLDDPADHVSGSAWDRLLLVTGERAHPGRWLSAVLGVATVFVLGFVVVLGWLWQQTPVHGAAASVPVVKKRPLDSVATRRPAIHPSTPPPLPIPLVSPSPTLAAATPVPEPPVPGPVAPVWAGEPSAVPTTPVPERLTTVRLDSVPPGAQIRVGDEVLGTTPCRVHLPQGDHQLIARYQDWPETRQTIHVDGAETRAVEIRLMRPDLVPGLGSAPENHARRIAAPAERRVPGADPTAPAVRPAAGGPEVRPAQRILTPFQIDPPGETSPTPAVMRPTPPATGDGPQN